MNTGIVSFSGGFKDIDASEAPPPNHTSTRSNEEAIYLAIVNQDWLYASDLLGTCSGRVSEGKIKKLLYFTYFNDMKKISFRSKWMLDRSLLDMVRILESDPKLANTLKSKRGVPAYVTLLNNILKTNGHLLSEFSPKSQAMISKDTLKGILLNKTVRQAIESARVDSKKIFDFIRKKHEKWVHDFFCKVGNCDDSNSLLQGENLIASIGQSIKSRKPINVLEAKVALVDMLEMVDELDQETRLNSLSSNSPAQQKLDQQSGLLENQPAFENEKENLLERISGLSENETIKVDGSQFEAPFFISRKLLELQLDYSKNLLLISSKIPIGEKEKSTLTINPSLARTAEQLERCLCYAD